MKQVRLYVSPFLADAEIRLEGLLAGSGDSPTRGYEDSLLEDLE